MKKYILVACCLLPAFFASSQKQWSLRECIDYAIENNVEIKQQDLNVKNADIDLNTIKSSRLPDVNASLGQRFNFGRSPNPGTGIYEENKASSTSLYLESNTPIFTGFKIPNQIKMNEMDLKAAMEGLEKARDNMQLQIASYYLDILFKKEILKVYQEQEALTEKQVTRTNILVETGKVALSQLYDIKAQLAKDQLNVTTANNDLKLSLLDLAQAMNLTSVADFDVEVPAIPQNSLPANVLSSLVSPDLVYEQSLQVKPHVKEAEYKIEGSKYGLKVAQAAYWPTLSLGLSYNNAFSHIYGSDNAKIGDQLKNNYRAVIGLTLSIPIFNRFETRNQVRKARLDIQNQELNLMNVKLALYKEIQQAYQNAVAAESKYVSTEKAYEAAAESFKYAEERYQIGKSTVFEYSEAQTKLINSRSEQIQAKYDFVFRTKILDFYQGKEIDI